MKKTYEQIFDMLGSSPIRVGQTWRHYKGTLYRVEDLLVDCDTNEIILAYTNADPWEASTIKFARPLSEWLEEVEPGIQRFCRVRSRTLMMTDDEFEIMETITKNKKETPDEGLVGVRKLWNRISRCFGY